MKLKYTLVCLINFFVVYYDAGQNTIHYNRELGTPSYLNGDGLKTANGNSTITTSYTNTACGLDYVQASVFLSKKAFSFGPGINQPAPLVVSGLPPQLCTNILKAFLYVSTSGNGAPITATLTNPQSVTSSFSMSIIGNDVDVCWSYAGTYTYRADVTSIISSNGTYSLSGIPVLPAPNNDAQGATLFIVYADPTQNFSGSIVIADGTAVGVTASRTATIGGFNVCASPSLSSNFIIISDLQKISNTQINLNSATSNYVLPTSAQNGYNFISDPGSPAIIGQTTAKYAVNNSGDCFNFMLAGMYYRTTCLTCTLSPLAPTLTVSSSNNIICSGNQATLSASGASTYTWSNASLASSIVVSPTITTSYTVYGSNSSGCASSVITESVSICSGIHENQESFASLINIYPNPSDGVLYLDLKEKTEKIELTIYNALGQLIHGVPVTDKTTQISLQNCAPGIYNAVLKVNSTIVFTKKIILN